MTALLVAAAVAVMGQARPSRTVTANKFVLLDSQGRARITIATPASMGTGVVGMGSDDPGIWISDEKGQDRCTLTDDGMRLSDGSGRPRAELTGYGYPIHGERFFAKGTKPAVGLPDQVSLNQGGLFFEEHGHAVIILGVVSPVRGTGVPSNPPHPFLGLVTDGSQVSVEGGNSPQVRIDDARGFSTVIGSTAELTPTTGETHHTSAANIVMFGKKGRAIWSAPPQ